MLFVEANLMVPGSAQSLCPRPGPARDSPSLDPANGVSFVQMYMLHGISFLTFKLSIPSRAPEKGKFSYTRDSQSPKWGFQRGLPPLAAGGIFDS